MKVPKYIKNNLERQAEYSLKIRELSKQFIEWCENNNIDVGERNFENAHGYIQGDCSADEMLTYLEFDCELKENNNGTN